jgi:hypothetical protein
LANLQRALVNLAVSVLVLADKFGRSLVSLSYLKHGVVHVDTSLLAVLAKIVVAANRTHESNATDWAHLATVTDNSVEYFISLV